MGRYDAWRRELDATRRAGRTRRLRTLRPTGPVTGALDGRPVRVFCSNDYLGLAADPRMAAAGVGSGAGSSRLIAGDRPLHRELERAVEAWLGRPALLFSSGYHANLGVLGAALGPDDVVASDALNHASIIDGLRLGRAARRIVPHADPAAIPADATAIVVECLFSMDGDVPPLGDYPRDPLLFVDEAHAIGCLGPDGRGAAAAAGRDPDVVIGTFGKALGAHGAFVAGPPELIDLLINKARSFIFTTGPSEPAVALALRGLAIARAEPERRARLAENAARLRRGLTDLGWRALGEAHIVPVVVGEGAVDLDARLLEAGFFAAAIRPPTVAPGTERVRFTVSAAHAPDDIDALLDAMGPRC